MTTTKSYFAAGDGYPSGGPCGLASNDVPALSRFTNRDRFAAYNGTAPIEVSSGKRKVNRLSRRGNRRVNHAIHRRRHPGPPEAQRGPRLLRQETRRGQDPPGSPSLPETAGQRHCLHLPADRRPAHPGAGQGPGRAVGERLCSQRGRITPQQPALRASHPRAWPPAYDPRSRNCRLTHPSGQNPGASLTGDPGISRTRDAPPGDLWLTSIDCRRWQAVDDQSESLSEADVSVPLSRVNHPT
jgi:hypothetical protein